MLIVLLSLGLRRPFSLQYARERAQQARRDSPAFMRVNYVVSAAWALAFGMLVLADALLAFMPALPPAVGIVVTVVALAGAAWFTGWYPAHRRAGEQPHDPAL